MTVALVSVFMVAVPASAAPATIVVGDYQYLYDDADVPAGATITDYVGSDAVVTIPGIVVIGPDTYDVTAIGGFAFYHKGLTSVTIPDSVITIGDSAFYDSALASVTFGDSVTTIDQYAFCINDLASITLPESVITIGESAFAYNDLTSVTIPASVATIGDWVFWNNVLNSVLMQGPVPSSIGPGVFGPDGGATPVVSYYARFTASGYTAPTWTANGYVYQSQALATVSYDTGPATPMGDIDVVVPGPMAEPATPSADGYRFLGWFLAPASGTAVTFPLPVLVDATLYAHWEARVVTNIATVGVDSPFSVTGSGFEPGESVEVWLQPDGVLLSTVLASGTGTLDTTVTIPEGATLGVHQLSVVGASTGTTTGDITVNFVLAATGAHNVIPLAGAALLLLLTGAGFMMASRRLRVSTP